LKRRWSNLTFGFALAVLLLCSCRKESATYIPDGIIKGALERAEQEGRTMTEIRIPFEPPEDLSLGLAQALQRTSVFVVKPTGRSVVSVQSSALFTWHVLRIEDAISLKPPNRGACGLSRPAAVTPGPGEAALPLVQGSVARKGITLRMKGRDETIHLERGASYVLLVENCPEGSFTMRLGPSAVIRVAAGGMLRPSDGGRAAFSGELAGMTLDQLRQLAAAK